MGREIPWNWLRPGPERDAARARDKRRREGMSEAARARARAELRAVTSAERHAEIRRLWGEGSSGVKLAARFGLARSTVSWIVSDAPRGRRYGEPGDVAWPRPRRHHQGGQPVPRPARPAREPGPPDPADALGPRAVAPKGSAHGRAKLDEARVARMKRLRLEGWTTGDLAREFGVGRNTVSYITSGKTWTHVEPASSENGGTA